MATLLPSLRAWRRPLVAGAAACLFLWQALILAVLAPAHGAHAAEGGAAVSSTLCAARAADGGRTPAHPDSSRHCAVCVLGEGDASLALFAPLAAVVLASAPLSAGPAARFPNSPAPSPPGRAVSASPRAPPSIV